MMPTGSAMEVQVIEGIPDQGLLVDIVSVNWSELATIVDIRGVESGELHRVVVSNELGNGSLRLLDESDLSEPTQPFSLAQGWLYRVVSGGWFDQEALRSGFVSTHAADLLDEYLIIGQDTCVSLITKQALQIQDAHGETILEVN